ncbi:MAG: hypothetical protein P1R58_08170 [bacterium]|nr:hypothetical protein [bacterium]
MKSSFDLSFLDRTLRTTAIVFLIMLPFGIYYFGVFPTLAAYSGGIWGMINLIFISALVRSAIRPDGADKNRAIVLSLIKFPLLYSSGYFLLTVEKFSAIHLLIGFSATMVVLVLKAAGRLMLHLDEKEVEQGKLGKVH